MNIYSYYNFLSDFFYLIIINGFEFFFFFTIGLWVVYS